MENIEELTKRYHETFGPLPRMPIMVSYTLIADLMEEAIISKVPVSQTDINERVSEISEPIDLSR